MLRPSKHSHPDKTVISVSTVILKKIKKDRVSSLDDILVHVKKKVSGNEILVMPSLSFLYLVGLIEYHSKNDTIEYVGDYDSF